MSQSHNVPNTYKAAADFTDKKFHAVIVSAQQTVAIAGAAGDAIGILQNEPDAAGKAALVAEAGSGTSEVIAGAAFAVGARLASNAAGRLIAATAGQHYIAIAREAATADGDRVEALLTKGLVAA